MSQEERPGTKKAKSRGVKTKVQTISENDRLFLTYYTDPLCCWSWGMHAAISKLKEEYETASWRYVVGGLIPDWQNFCDPVNSVTRPLQWDLCGCTHHRYQGYPLIIIYGSVILLSHLIPHVLLLKQCNCNRRNMR